MADTQLIPANLQVPAHVQKLMSQPSALAQSVMGGLSTGADYPRISIKGSRFRIVEGGAEQVLDTLKLDVVIVGANPRLSKTFYLEKWNPDQAEGKSPDCYSLNGIAPVPESPQRQNDICATCPQNRWGSKVVDGKELKACADQKRLAVVAADDPGGPVYLLQVTPAALQGLNKYQRELTMRGIPAEVVRTTVGFDTDASFPKLTFAFGGFNTEENQLIVNDLFSAPAVMAVTGETQTPEPAVPAASAPAQRPASVTVAPSPPPPPPPPPPAPPEPPKRGFGAAKAAPATATVQQTAPAAAKPAAAPAVSNSADLAKEIGGLIDSLGMDD